MYKIHFQITLYRAYPGQVDALEHYVGNANTELPYIPSVGMVINQFKIKYVEVKEDCFFVGLGTIEDPNSDSYPYHRYINSQEMMRHVRVNFIPELNWIFAEHIL